MTITFKTKQSLKEYDAVSLAEMLRADFVLRYPAATVERLSDAIQVASFLHRNDVRRGSRNKSATPPYIEHPLRVAIRLIRYFDVQDSDVIIAAILHDTVEDHSHEFDAFEGVGDLEGATEEGARRAALGFIGRHFGYQVAKLVEWVSNPVVEPGVSKPVKLTIYQGHVKASVSSSSSALIIKISDFKDNAGSLHHHYPYGDPKVSYFLDRYEPLIEIYRSALAKGPHDFDVKRAMQAIDEVEAQFDRFRTAAA